MQGFNSKKLEDVFRRKREKIRHRNGNLKKVVLKKKVHPRMKLGLLKYGFDVGESQN